MAVAAYASGNSDPVSNPHVDSILDLASLALPQDVQLYGAAEDDEDGSPVWTWEWTILQKPTGSSAELDNDSSQNPTLEGVDVWGNYLLFLVATNTHNGNAQSENDPLLAPTTAFVVVRVKSATRGLQKLAPGERNYHEQIHEVVAALEGVGSGDHDIQSHSDVANATGADLDVLVSQGLADDPNDAGKDLHTHRGTSVEKATTAAQGVVFLEDAPVDPANPKAITQERLLFTGQSDVSQTAAGPTLGITVNDLSVLPNRSKGHLIFYVREAIQLDRWDVQLLDGGALKETFEFNLFKAVSAANLKSNTLADINGAGGTTISEAVGAAHEPLVGFKNLGAGFDIAAGNYLVVVVSEAPELNMGAGLQVTIWARRKV